MTAPADGRPAATAPPRSPYLLWAPDPGAALRLFCFHHAGGAASSYQEWEQALGPRVGVVPVQLPGRERRVREPRFRDLRPLLAELDAHLAAHLDQPYALYGHSMGGLVAYAFARHLHRTGRALPSALLIGAYPAPGSPPPLAEAANHLDDVQLARRLVDLGGMSPVLLDYPEWRDSALAMIRDDLAVCSSYRPVAGPPLPCPVHVFAGTDDPLFAPGDAADWADFTAGGLTVHAVPGGHLFHREPRAAVPARVSALLAS